MVSGLVDDIKTLTADTIPETTEIFDINGWEVYTNKLSGEISNIVDPDNSTNRVIQLQGSGTDTGFRYTFSTPDSDNTSIEWKMKYSEAYTVYISVQTTLGHRYLYYTSVDYDALGSGRYVHHWTWASKHKTANGIQSREIFLRIFRMRSQAIA